MPVPKGGGARLADALVRLIEDNGGVCRTRPRSTSIVVRDGGADGVRTAAGETVEAERAVIANVTPTQLYGRAARRSPTSRRARPGAASATAAPRCRSTSRSPSRRAGRATSGSAQTAIVHVTPGLDGVSRAVNEAERGLLPGRGDRRLRPAAHDRPEPRARGEGDPLDPAPGAAVARQGRRRRRARHRRRHVDGGAARALRRPDPGAARAAHPEPRVVDPRAHVPLAGRPPGREPEPPPRRPVLRLARARPELPLAPVRRAARPPDAGRPPLAHRREHLARPGPRRRLGDDRRAGAARSSCRSSGCAEGCFRAPMSSRLPGRERCGKIAPAPLRRRDTSMPTTPETTRRRSAPRFSISQISTLGASFDEDLAAYAAAGLDGIGIWELKLPEDGDDARRARGVRAERARAGVGRADDPRRSCRCRCSAARPTRRSGSTPCAPRSTGSPPSARPRSSA